jgi:probable rRNA maturation factor
MIQNRSSSNIQVLNRQRQFRIRGRAVSAFCAEVLCSLEKTGPGLSVVFVNAREMRALNGNYRGRDYATDVLSFCYEDLRVEGRLFLGEIIVAPEVAARQAAQYRISAEKELRKLLVHGILHLLGYDHETDKGKMQRLQAKLLRRKMFSNPPSLLIKKERP